MKKCKTCNINFNTERFTCPFCKNNLEETNKENNVQSYPKFKDKIYKVNWTQKTFIFLTIVTCLIIGISNYYEFKKGNNSLWSIITLMGIITGWTLIKGLIISRKNAAKRIFDFGASLVLLMLSIEYLSIINKNSPSNWSINYVIPLILLATATTINLVIICDKKNFSNYIDYSLGTSIILILYHLLYILNITNVLWTSTLCFTYGVTAIIALFFFGGKATIQELKKRLTL